MNEQDAAEMWKRDPTLYQQAGLTSFAKYRRLSLQWKYNVLFCWNFHSTPSGKEVQNLYRHFFSPIKLHFEVGT